MKRIALCAALVLGFTGSAFAQTEENVRQEPDREVVRDRTEIEFFGTMVKGTVEKPLTQILDSRRAAKFKNLIEIRDNFDYELQRSVDNL